MSPEALDERLRALSHPVRRALLAACMHDARPAGALAALTELAPASISEHLKVMRKSGLLLLERDGRFWRYRAQPEAVLDVADALVALAHSDALGVACPVEPLGSAGSGRQRKVGAPRRSRQAGS